MSLVQRDDLSQRTGLSKSAIGAFDLCSQKAWQKKHHPRDFIPKPKMTFGSCVDAGAEVLVKYVASGQPPDIDRAMAASLEVQERDQVEVDQDEVRLALTRFVTDVIPAFDWAYCKTQAHIRVPLEDWGEVDGHPDLILSTRAVWDVKTSTKPKQTARTVELGIYALLVEEDTGDPVPEVGYLAWVRDGHGGGYWQGFGDDAIHTRELKTGPRKGQLVEEGHEVPHTYVDDELRRWTRERVAAYVRADRADDLLNGERAKRGLEPLNYTFPGFAVNADICVDCEFNPKLGGACQMAPRNDVTEEGSDAA